jgi:hypothetical protein
MDLMLSFLFLFSTSDHPAMARGQSTAGKLKPVDAKSHVGEVASVCGVAVVHHCNDEGTEFILDG